MYAALVKRIYRRMRNAKRSHSCPGYLTWFVTERCNLRCVHCFVNSPHHSPRQEMPVEDAIRFIKTSGLRSITFTGGEPLLHKPFEQLLDACTEYNIPFSICTNGFDSQKLLSILAKYSPRCPIQTSLDGDKEVHNRIRGNGDSFDHVVELIEGAKRNSHKVTVVSTISKDNIASLDYVLDFCRQQNIGIIPNLIRSSEQVQAERQSDFVPAQRNDLCVEEIKSCFNKWYASARRHMDFVDVVTTVIKSRQILKFLETGQWDYKCAAGISDAVLFPNGDVAICEMLQPIGNIRDFDYNWESFWQNQPRTMHECYCQWDCAMIESVFSSFPGILAAANAVCSVLLFRKHRIV